MSSNENQRKEDDEAADDEKDHRRPSVQETYASKIYAAKLHIAANAAYEAIQRVEAQRSAEAAANSNSKHGEDDDVMMDISAEMSSANFFRGSISEPSVGITEAKARQRLAREAREKFVQSTRREICSVNETTCRFTKEFLEALTDQEIIEFDDDTKAKFEALPGPSSFGQREVDIMISTMQEGDKSEKKTAVASPKRKSVVEEEGLHVCTNVAGPPGLKRSRSEPRPAGLSNAYSPTSGKTAVLELIRARSETQHSKQVQDEDDESIRLHEEIHQLAEQNRELWDKCDVGRKNRAKPEHNTHISVVHETMVSEEEEDQDEAAKGLICFTTQYHTAVITVREGEPVVAVGIDKKKSKAITSMMAGLARSIPNQFTDFIHVKEATSDGFILAYRVSPTIYRICGEAERVEILRGFKKHLSSIRASLKETHDWLKKADTWNKYLDEETEKNSHPDCNSGLCDGKIEYLMMREEAEALEKTLKTNAPSEIDAVVTWEYEIS